MSEPMPTEGAESVFKAVHKDLEARERRGIETYGRSLETFNGRNALQDAYEEALDLAMYLKQALLEQEN